MSPTASERSRCRRGWEAAAKRLGVASLAAILAACGSAPTSVVLITIDTLRADHLGCYGYFRDTSPVIDELATESLLFERAVSVAGTTLPAHVSLMTSTYPARHGVISNLAALPLDESGGGLVTMAQMLRRAGYTTAGFVSSMIVDFESGLAAGFDQYDVPAGPLRSAGETTARVRSWLDERPDGPVFLWVHYMDPHFPYQPPPRFASMFETDGELMAHLAATRVPRKLRAKAARSTNAYDAEIRYADEQVGELLGALRTAGLYDESVIVLAGDHGEGLYQHSVPHHDVIFNEQLDVPLMIRFPRQAAVQPGRRPELISLIDVLPTIAARVDLPLDADQFDGIDVLSESRSSALAQRAKDEIRFDGGAFALVEGRWKYFLRTDSRDQLFDLERDPHETRNVIARHQGIARAMRTRLLDTLSDSESRGGHIPAPGPSETKLQTLRSLGYIQ